MKSGKQRKSEIKSKRKKNDLPLELLLKGKTYDEAKLISGSIIWADQSELKHNITEGKLPEYYFDQDFVCIECSAKSIWTAKSQKWWYESAKGSIWSKASRCPKCRAIRKLEKETQKAHMDKMAKVTPHPNEKFFKSI
ncbi:zinc-ribbon domain containing protein [Marinicellulosiphila megalodicopiae]|uniref:zinc-ribbon domain containing protein n=1 Tax=Marinicellulosiphila megalodicopiae TaxID=2724896 RepID=UPI003BB12094